MTFMFMKNNQLVAKLPRSSFLLLLTGKTEDAPLSEEFNPFIYRYEDLKGDEASVMIDSVELHWDRVYHYLENDDFSIQSIDLIENPINVDEAGRKVLSFQTSLSYKNLPEFNVDHSGVSLPDNLVNVELFEQVILDKFGDLRFGIDNKLIDLDLSFAESGQAKLEYPLSIHTFDYSEGDMLYSTSDGDDIEDNSLSDSLTKYLFEQGVPKINKPGYWGDKVRLIISVSGLKTFKVVNTDTNEVIVAFDQEGDATRFAVSLEIKRLKKLNKNYEKDNGVKLEELPDFEILEESIYKVVS